MMAPDRRGRSCPLGAAVEGGGVNFSVYSRDATAMELLLFDGEKDAKPSHVISFSPSSNRTSHYWHVFVPGIGPGQIYGYRAFGRYDPASGLRFDPSKILVDPYGRGMAIPGGSRRPSANIGDNTATAMKSVVVNVDKYDWEGDLPLSRSVSETIVYEMHVAGFTKNPNSGVAAEKRGTFAGVIEKIPYLKQLGITAVELLPIFQYDVEDAPPGLVNYWGYAPVSFFSPHRAYSSRQDLLGPNDEFRDMVKALHRAGIEVILDVVFNHTAEDALEGPTYSFRGLDNKTYYMLEGDDFRYSNFSGTGNTLNTNHPVVRRMILDSLLYWVDVMHVDGFRFDLASILSRDLSGGVIPNPPVVWDIDSHPMLAGTKIIAEAWDASGLYQLGTFLGDNWREWNGKFRDDVRCFFRGDSDTVKKIADRLLGSPDIFGNDSREAEQSVNFITCHDGFTINDLVSYNIKHNEENGDCGRDGANENNSWNCGVEGPSEDATIESLRNRQVKNLLTVTLLSLGLPMILMGDEVRRTQLGNNNAYCHDSEISWFDWSLVEKHEDILRFVSLLNRRRVLRNLQGAADNLCLIELLRRADRAWHGTKLYQPDWGDNSHSLAISAVLHQEGLVFHMIMNAYWESLEFELSPIDSGETNPWRRWIDTSLDSPEDIVVWEEAQSIPGFIYSAGPRSVVLLFARLHTGNRESGVGV